MTPAQRKVLAQFAAYPTNTIRQTRGVGERLAQMGLIEHAGPTWHDYRITPAGREALS